MSNNRIAMQVAEPLWTDVLAAEATPNKKAGRPLKIAGSLVVASALVMAACSDSDNNNESSDTVSIQAEVDVAVSEATSGLEEQIATLEGQVDEQSEIIAEYQETIEDLTEELEAEEEQAVEVVVDEEVEETEVEETEALTEDELKWFYGNIITGVTSAKEVGKFEILTQDSETSKNNFYNEIRHNPQTLAFYDVCLDQQVPNYDNCADEQDPEGSAVLEDAAVRLTEVSAMSLEEKAQVAEDVIAKFEAMNFDGVEVHNGHYQTMRLKLDAQGNVVGYEESTNNRVNDPRIHFSYVDKDGNTQVIVVRSCAQITQDIPTVTPPETTVPETTVPETTVPETTVPETTVPETTVPPKNDDGELPDTGIPADQDPGTPDVPGEGPAGQTPNDEGYIPTETPPSSQAPDTTQLPAPTTTENPVPATEGTPPVSTNPPVEAPNNPTPETPENGTLPADPSSLTLFPLGLGAAALARRRANSEIKPLKGDR